MAPRAAVLLSKGFSVLLIDFQAHGETLGQAITLGWRESSDVLAALAWLKAQGSRRRIGAIGVSLGGASILLGPQPMGFDAIVLEAVYPRIGRAVENRVRRRAGVLTPILSALLLAQIPLRLHVCPHDLEPIRYIAKVGAPVLVVAGSVDLDTTLGESDELFRAAIHPKQMWIVRGAGHQDFLRYDAAGYESHVIRFLIDQLQPAIKAS